MIPIILISLGSPDPKWRQPFFDLTTTLQQTLNTSYIYTCFMEIASPTLDDIAKELISKQQFHAKVLPLFMASGGHVDKDIPKQIKMVHEQFPNLSLTLLPPIGEHQLVVDATTQVISGEFNS
mgnify:CR=1 FL=1